jgi:hypothetical protein
MILLHTSNQLHLVFDGRLVKVNYGGFGGSYAGAYGGSPYIGVSIGDCGYGGNLLAYIFN